MKEITKEMIYLYKMTNIDWMGYKLIKKDQFTYHHIQKKEDNGQITIENGAILCGNSSHPYLHIIEYKDYDRYVYINNLLKKINEQQEQPNIQQLKAINEILKVFEKEHCADRSKKGKRLIKEEFTKRIIL